MSLPMPHFAIAVAQMRPVPMNVRANLARMLSYIERARVEGAKLIVFPELCTSGYLLGDRWEHDDFIREIEAANEVLVRASRDIAVVWGSVNADWQKLGEDGRVRKYNSAFLAHGGRLVGWVPKTNLPKYRIFDDARHFYPAAKLAAEQDRELSDLLQPFLIDVGRPVKVALTVCEDLWEDEYNTKPSVLYGKQGVDLIIDISSSPWTAQKWHARNLMLRKRARDARCYILYVNIVGLQNNAKNLVWFDGASALLDAQGEYHWQAAANAEKLYLLQQLNLGSHWRGPIFSHRSEIDEIFDAMVAAMREFYGPFKRVVVGLSGGIDSAVAAAMLVEAVGAKKVLAVNMPTKHNSPTTRRLAEQCAQNLGVEYRVSSIEEVYETELDARSTRGQDSAPLVKENIQARARGSRLARIAADEEGVFTCNGNKTEVALNYFTLYGDGAGAAAFLADLWKGQVYELARYLNERRGREVIPQGIIDIVPSAELSADQNVDEGKGDPIFYPYHDRLLRAFIEKRWDPTEVVRRLLAGTLEQDLGCEPGTIRRYFKTDDDLLVNLQWCWSMYSREYKRHQLPPVFITSRRAFGFDRRDTIAEGYLTDEYHRLAARVRAQAA